MDDSGVGDGVSAEEEHGACGISAVDAWEGWPKVVVNSRRWWLDVVVGCVEVVIKGCWLPPEVVGSCQRWLPTVRDGVQPLEVVAKVVVRGDHQRWWLEVVVAADGKWWLSEEITGDNGWRGAQVVAYTAIFSCGNYQGVARLAKAKGLAVPIAHKKEEENSEIKIVLYFFRFDQINMLIENKGSEEDEVPFLPQTYGSVIRRLFYLMMTRDSATGLPLLSKTGFLMDGIAVENEGALVGQILFQVLVPDALRLQKPI
ncbi:hypothetical protein TEA_020692 [Camellia sinensis var. sinensis]|uniref:Uncharacterized protein n=1 Tax=Camellia sinensis var. sinensis TaxID=542762 RepID=A0A4S4D852_CAMSN|nr:hypothetical protein TEA_020692 [Camellia sinensis var. sinensis]